MSLAGICRELLGFIGRQAVVRVVFSDESGVGSKKKEPITVVTAIVLNMDRQWEPVSNSLHAVLSEAHDKHKGLLEEGRALKGKLLYSAIRRGITAADSILRATLQIVADQKIVVFLWCGRPNRI